VELGENFARPMVFERSFATPTRRCSYAKRAVNSNLVHVSYLKGAPPPSFTRHTVKGIYIDAARIVLTYKLARFN